MSVVASGTQTATISTNHTLHSTTTAGVYQLIVDLNNLVNGDRVLLTISQKVLTGGTVRQTQSVPYQDAQGGDKVAHSIPIRCPFGCDVVLRQEAGTGRAFDWSLDRLDA